MSAFALDLSVLRLLKHRDKYARFAKMIPEGTINKETAALVKRFGEFFKATEADTITHAEFWPFLRTRYPNWKEKDIQFWQALTKPIDQPNPLGIEELIVSNLLTKSLGAQALTLIEQWNGGGEVELGEALRRLVDDHDKAMNRKVKAATVELGWEEMIEEETNDVGLHWRIRALRNSTRALRAGDFGIIALRPDRGKTTLVASEVTYFAPQLRELYPDDVRPVLWLNNEGPGRRIVSRLRQSAIGMSVSEIVKLGPAKAQAAYIEAIGGREDMIRVVDIHGYSSYDVEELIRRHRPGVTVLDMVDNIRFSGRALNGGERTDQILESMYGEAREWMVKYDSIGIATSQLSAAAENVKYPPQTDLKDSRTGKQGACDFIITGGVDNNQPNTRYIGFTKNKIKREGAKYSPMAAYYFDADRGRLVEPEDEQ